MNEFIQLKIWVADECARTGLSKSAIHMRFKRERKRRKKGESPKWYPNLEFKIVNARLIYVREVLQRAQGKALQK